MSTVTLDYLQSQVAALVDQNEATSAISSTDYSLRLNFINRSLTEWAESYDWDSMYKIYYGVISTSTGNTSIALPTNFRKLASFPLITYDGVNTKEFPQVLPIEDKQFNDTDLRC